MSQQGSNNGGVFFMVPLGASRDKAVAPYTSGWDNGVLSVYIVLLAHENTVSRIAYPSLDRVSALAGVSKTTAQKAVQMLRDISRVNVCKQKNRQTGNIKNVFTFQHPSYHNAEDTSQYFPVYKEVIFYGLWASMPPSTRKLYLCLSDLGLMPGKEEGDYIYDEYMTDAVSEREYLFIKYLHYDPHFLENRAGISQQARYRGIQWLKEKGILEASESCNGVNFHVKTGLQDKTVLDRLRKVREQSNPCERRGRLAANRLGKKNNRGDHDISNNDQIMASK